MFKKIVMACMAMGWVATVDAVEIDISRAQVEITRDQYILMDGVAAMDKVGWMLLAWDADDNVYRVADFGESDPEPGDCPSVVGHWEVTDDRQREPYTVTFGERGSFEDDLGGSGEWAQRECSVSWTYSDRGASYEGAMAEDGAVMGGRWSDAREDGQWRAVRIRE